MEEIWSCKIGGCDSTKVPNGADYPMRRAIETVYIKITGEDPKFIFSGWGSELTELEREIINEKGE